MNSIAMVDVAFDEDLDLDAIEEMRYRTWARQHYAPAEDRDVNWHPVVLDEMDRIDRETVLR